MIYFQCTTTTLEGNDDSLIQRSPLRQSTYNTDQEMFFFRMNYKVFIIWYSQETLLDKDFTQALDFNTQSVAKWLLILIFVHPHLRAMLYSTF